MRKNPNPKSQIPNKFQNPNLNENVDRVGVKRGRFRSSVGIWNLRFGICLDFGFWILKFRRVILLFTILFPLDSSAHIGDPNVFFEGQAGPYPVRIVVRAPGVIPGLAEISVRVNTNGVQRVEALPMHWKASREGAPPPDEAKPVRGDRKSTRLNSSHG